MSGVSAERGETLVLTWHSISDGPAPLCIPAAQLEAQLDLLERTGHRVAPLAELVAALGAARALPGRVCVLTFDDGYRDFAHAALPILERRGLPATLFVTAGADRTRLAGGVRDGLLPLEALPELARRNVELGAHSVSHADLTRLGDAALEDELAEGRHVLERHSEAPVEHLAYPFGRFDARVRAAAARHYRAALTTQLCVVGAEADPFAIPRVDAHYLRSRLVRGLLARGQLAAYLRVRRTLRRLRGSEPLRTHPGRSR